MKDQTAPLHNWMMMVSFVISIARKERMMAMKILNRRESTMTTRMRNRGLEKLIVPVIAIRRRQLSCKHPAHHFERRMRKSVIDPMESN